MAHAIEIQEYHFVALCRRIFQVIHKGSQISLSETCRQVLGRENAMQASSNSCLGNERIKKRTVIYISNFEVQDLEPHLQSNGKAKSKIAS